MPTTIDEYLEAQRAEWGQYVATEAIDVDGVRAFNAGDPVPASHVAREVVPATAVRKVEQPEPEQAVDLTPADPDVPAEPATAARSTTKKGN
jgi:hypothetical protein